MGDGALLLVVLGSLEGWLEGRLMGWRVGLDFGKVDG
jgi:hypothetical protein